MSEKFSSVTKKPQNKQAKTLLQYLLCVMLMYFECDACAFSKSIQKVEIVSISEF